MTAKRLGAVVAAVVLIVGALVLRRTVLDADATGPTNTTPTSTGTDPSVPRPPSGEATELICITELGAICRTIAPTLRGVTVRVEPADTTLRRLSEAADSATTSMWLTIQPYPAMVDALRTTANGDAIAWTTEPLAATRLVMGMPQDGRAEALVAGCAGRPLWACVGEHAGGPWTDLGGDAAWRTVRPSIGAADREAIALASFANSVAGYLGGTQVNRNAWEADPSFIPWLNRLVDTVSPSALSAGTPAATMATRAGSLDIAATTEAELRALGDRFAVNYPEPSMWAEAVLAVPDGIAAPDGAVPVLIEVLIANGWGPASAATQPLPNANTMLALRALWQQST